MAFTFHRVIHGALREFLKGFSRSEEWSAVRRTWLKSNPTCAACGGTALLQVHHVAPFHLDPQLELNLTNLITLCQAKLCHLYLGHGDDWQYYCPNVRALAAEFLVADPIGRADLIKAAKAGRIK